ncbi:MAG: hypothetical protein LPK88_07560 [Alphaproteobacteria bacterium]|nr:hypothetical protein [Alphaproteobacteria bacterium]MDX5416160.1 hypothetical protein [Alphaproteobacteria bacterium]MDX5493466.1 hypothetical protein [Alphaproteobacteria bacterium]
MSDKSRRNPMTPWWIGFAIILAVVIYFGYRFSCLECGHPGGFIEFIVLALVPAVYLTLMYITLKDQADSEK